MIMPKRSKRVPNVLPPFHADLLYGKAPVMYATVTCGECGDVVAEVQGRDRDDIEKRAIKGMKCPKDRCKRYDLLRLHLHKEKAS
jgi:hypothetical protein